MTNEEREELIEKMARALAQSHVNGLVYQDAARAALAVAEPVIREQAQNALREENARLRAALKPFADDADYKFATYSNAYLQDAAAAIREGENYE